MVRDDFPSPSGDTAGLAEPPAPHVDGAGQSATIELPPRPALRAAPLAAPPRLVEGPIPSLEAETVRLLRMRLRAAVRFLFLAFFVFFVRNLFLDVPTERLLQGIVLIALAAGDLTLSLRRAWRLGNLRAMEWALFGLVGLYGWLSLHLDLVEEIDPTLITTFASPMRDCVRDVTLVAVLYGTFVPNTWRGAARVVLPLAAIPALATLSVAAQRPDLIPRMGVEIATFEQASGLTLTLVLGVVLALYGAHTVHDLRTREYAARQFGQYRLLAPIGRGGMGEVFLAEHRLLKRPCALKVIRAESRGNALALARFGREARSLARMSHPNSVAIYDYGHAADGSFYLAMEYVRGLTFDQLVERHGPLPPGRAIALLRQACGALAEAHLQGMIHRDVKPSNLMVAAPVGRFDVVKLLDFGLVRLDDTLASRSGGTRGTPMFMAPEQAAGTPRLDGRADLYALGGTAYYLLTGRPPFDPPSAAAALIAHRLHAVEPPSRFRPEIPADLEALVLRCLAKRPEDRPADATALDRALADCAIGTTWDSADAAGWWRSAEPGLIGSGGDAIPPAPAFVNLG